MPLVVRSSPLIRCVQTAAQICSALGLPEQPVQIDDALCEEQSHLRPRMMGTHRASVQAADRTAVAPTCEVAPRGVCAPVLLRPGDLVSVHRHIDVAHRGTACLVEHDRRTGCELDGRTGAPRSAQQRARAVVASIGTLAPVGCATVLVTHGAFARRLGELLVGEEGWANFRYAEVAQFECDGSRGDYGPGAWTLVGRWAPASDARRSSTRLD